MENRLRDVKGKFVKKKVLDKKKKIKAALLKLKKNASDPNPNLVCEGRRIVELRELGKNLKCCKCLNTLSLLDTVAENISGLNSCLTVKCQSCNVSTLVSTGKTHAGKESSKNLLADVNTKAALGNYWIYYIILRLFEI